LVVLPPGGYSKNPFRISVWKKHNRKKVADFLDKDYALRKQIIPGFSGFQVIQVYSNGQQGKIGADREVVIRIKAQV
jgi:hypothetical protein